MNGILQTNTTKFTKFAAIRNKSHLVLYQEKTNKHNYDKHTSSNLQNSHPLCVVIFNSLHASNFKDDRKTVLFILLNLKVG